MALRDALLFISRVREDSELASEVRGLGTSPELEELVTTGLRHGFAFSPEELRSAHRHDAAMRAIRYVGSVSSAGVDAPSSDSGSA